MTFTVEGFSERMKREAEQASALHPLDGGSVSELIKAGTDAMGRALVDFLSETLKDLDKPNPFGGPKVLHFGRVEILDSFGGLDTSSILASNFLEIDLPSPVVSGDSKVGIKRAGISSEIL